MGAIVFAAMVLGFIYQDSDSLIVYHDSLTLCGHRQYNVKVHIADHSKIFVRAWTGMDTTGWLTLSAPLILVEDSSQIVGDTAGYWGGTNTHANGYGPGYGSAGSVGGGGGAGYGGTGGDGGGIPGAGGVIYGSSNDTLIHMGSGGGAGRLGAVEGFGGNGGASIYLRASTLIIDSSIVRANGETGDTAAMVAGGGGSGGGIMLRADSVTTNCAALHASGGPGGPVDPDYGYGGGGAGGGRVKIFHAAFIDTAQLSISVQGGDAGIGGYGNGQPGSPGTIYFGQIVGIREFVNLTNWQFGMQPNPVRDIADITTEHFPATAGLYDVCGRLTMTIELPRKIVRIDLSALERGVYFMIIEEHPCQPYKIIRID